MAEKDPYRYFRIEAHDLVEALSRGLLALDRSAASAADRQGQVRELLRHAHTLKGAARVVRLTAIGQLAHRLEDVLVPLRDAEAAPETSTVDAALALVDQIRAQLADLSRPPETAAKRPPAAAPPSATTAPGARAPSAANAAPTPPTPTTAAAQREEPLASLRVGMDDLDALVEGLAETAAVAASLAREIALFAPLAHGLGDAIERAAQAALDKSDALASAIDEVRELASEMRLVPAETLTGELERTTRDAARALDKTVEMRVSGRDIKLDAAVLARLRGPLRHVVSNAVAHGIEDPLTRQRAGKPPAGRIDVDLAREGYRVAVTVADDGRGLDRAALLAAAVQRGLVTAEGAAALDERGLVDLLLRGGLSTAAGVDEVSGRGVGLDVVRQAVVAMKGDVEITTTPGRGTTVVLRVPLSLAALPSLALEAAGETLLVPLDSVRRTMRVVPADLSRTGDGERIVVDDVVMPFVALGPLLGRGAATRPRAAVVLEAAGRSAAIGVDRLGVIETVVTKPLPSRAPINPIVAAASLDAEGRARLVLAAGALVARAHDARPAPLPEVRRRAPVLVVDDSLTTRMLEQSILESAGYEVDVALSAEEALVKMRARRYGVAVVDVEMPGMSGFELLEHLQGDAQLSTLPAILVTSRAEPDDLRRGMAAGARAYIVKSDFDQRRLLDAVRGLVS